MPSAEISVEETRSVFRIAVFRFSTDEALVARL